MAEVLRPTNFDAINLEEKTALSADVASGQKVANVESAQGIIANNYYILGELGAELAELAQLDTKSGNALTALANYANAHKRGDAVTKLFGNKIKIYRAPNVDGSIPADGNFSLLATLDIDVDQKFTEYTDSTGGSDYWYKKTYYNSNDTSETDIAAAVAVRGGNYGNYATWEEVRSEAGLENNRWLPESLYQEKLLLAQGEVNASLKIGGYTLPLAEVPKLVKSATLLIAAGYVLLKDYGPEHSGTNKDGNQKLEQGRLLLKKIEEGGQTLVNDAGENVSRSTRVNGYPDETAEDLTPSEGNQFSVTDVY